MFIQFRLNNENWFNADIKVTEVFAEICKESCKLADDDDNDDDNTDELKNNDSNDCNNCSKDIINFVKDYKYRRKH